ASHLSLLVQRNLAQRKHTPPSRPVRCTGSAEPAGFSERASCPRGKRRASMRGALRVLSAGSAATEGPRRSRSRSRATANATATATATATALHPANPAGLAEAASTGGQQTIARIHAAPTVFLITQGAIPSRVARGRVEV